MNLDGVAITAEPGYRFPRWDDRDAGRGLADYDVIEIAGPGNLAGTIVCHPRDTDDVLAAEIEALEDRCRR